MKVYKWIVLSVILLGIENHSEGQAVNLVNQGNTNILTTAQIGQALNYDVQLVSGTGVNPNLTAQYSTGFIGIGTTSPSFALHIDGNGRVIKTVPIADRGQGSLLVYGSDLSSGTYSYTLLADGKVVDTKKMVKQ